MPQELLKFVESQWDATLDPRWPFLLTPNPYSPGARDPITPAESDVGIFADAQYHDSSRELCEGDTVLLFTDGLFEVRGSDEEYYDQHRLLSSALRCIDLRADDLCEQVVDDVQQFAATKDFADDVCLIAMEIDHLMKG